MRLFKSVGLLEVANQSNVGGLCQIARDPLLGVPRVPLRLPLDIPKRRAARAAVADHRLLKQRVDLEHLLVGGVGLQIHHVLGALLKLLGLGHYMFCERKLSAAPKLTKISLNTNEAFDER